MLGSNDRELRIVVGSAVVFESTERSYRLIKTYKSKRIGEFYSLIGVEVALNL